MQRGREARLDRLVGRLPRPECAAAKHRVGLRAWVRIGDIVRSGLAAMGIDPGRAVRLRVADEAAAALAAIPDSDKLRRADRKLLAAEPGRQEDADRVYEKLGRLADRYRRGDLPDPDPAHASPAELFAWCIARSPPKQSERHAASSPRRKRGASIGDNAAALPSSPDSIHGSHRE